MQVIRFLLVFLSYGKIKIIMSKKEPRETLMLLFGMCRYIPRFFFHIDSFDLAIQLPSSFVVLILLRLFGTHKKIDDAPFLFLNDKLTTYEKKMTSVRV